MVFSDTTNKNGLIQTCEFWCGMADAQISGDSFLLKQFTSRINSGFDRVVPLLLSDTDTIKWDDTNHTDFPVATFQINSGQNSYTFSEDDNSLDVLTIQRVRILTSSSATQYTDVTVVDLSDDKILDFLSPNSLDTGIPTKALIRGGTVYFSPTPNYTVAAGGKIFFEREQSYFASTDTTKEPGFPKPFHELLALHASHDWLLIFKPDATTLISRIEAEIQKKEEALYAMNNKRHRTKRTMRPLTESVE